MTKTLTIFLLLALLAAAGLYLDGVPGPSGAPVPASTPTATATVTATATATATVTPWTCTVFTGIDGGRVNLRACPGTSCAVLAVLTEGDRLTILTAGAWLNVTADNGMTGYINSKFCTTGE